MARAQTGMKNKPRDEDEVEDVEEDEDEAPVKAKASKRAVVEDEDDEDAPPPKSAKNGRRAAAAVADDDEDDAPPPRKARAAAVADDEEDPNDPIIDLGSADENNVGNYEVLPRGKYHTRVRETEFVEYKTGSKGMKVQLEVIEGEYAAGGKRKNGSIFFTNVVISPAALDILKASLKALGVEKKIWGAAMRLSELTRAVQRIADEGELVGNELVADVRIRTYEGDKRNEVKRMLPLSALAGEGAKSGDRFLED